DRQVELLPLRKLLGYIGLLAFQRQVGWLQYFGNLQLALGRPWQTACQQGFRMVDAQPLVAGGAIGQVPVMGLCQIQAIAFLKIVTLQYLTGQPMGVGLRRGRAVMVAMRGLTPSASGGPAGRLRRYARSPGQRRTTRWRPP